jgi:hypothetical protein
MIPRDVMQHLISSINTFTGSKRTMYASYRKLMQASSFWMNRSSSTLNGTIVLRLDTIVLRLDTIVIHLLSTNVEITWTANSLFNWNVSESKDDLYEHL